MGTFHFKKFSVCDDRTAMKVGTDAVLLGTWTDVQNAERILEIGTGSGVIALILAQRTSTHCSVHAVELHEADALQANENVRASPWSDRVHVYHTPIQEFRASPFDLIVCNPPYFSASQLPPDRKRAKVRHDLDLTAEDLLLSVQKALTGNGRFSLILPVAEAVRFVQKAVGFGLYLRRLTRFYSRKEKPQERTLMEFTFKMSVSDEDSLLLYSSGNTWTPRYYDLVKDFYLDKSTN